MPKRKKPFRSGKHGNDTTELLDCGHPPDAGMPANVDGRVVQGWQFVRTEDGRKICHSCADNVILDCGHKPSPHHYFATGYGRDEGGRKHCYSCCADLDRKYMEAHDRMLLYLSLGEARTSSARNGGSTYRRASFYAKVQNWPGSLAFPCYVRVGKHNLAGVRYDAWFADHRGREWHGVCVGGGTQILHCRKVTSR
jgi:hypothetical protein